MADIDPADYAVVSSGLTAIAEEMGEILQRSAHSSVVRETRDCATVVSDAGGDPSSVSHSDAAAGTSDVSPTAPTSDGSNHTTAEDADGGEHSDDDESDEPDHETEREGTDDFAETDELEPADHEGESTELEAADSPDETEPPQSSSLETGDLDDVTSEAP